MTDGINRRAHENEFSEIPGSLRLNFESQNISFCSNEDQVLPIKEHQQFQKGEEEPGRRRRQARSRKNKSRRYGRGVNSPPPSTPPTPPQLTSSGMTAIFLVGSGSRYGSSGTGVFLPSAIATSFQSGQQRGFSTVLIPARVVQALKLHFEKMGAQSKPPNLGNVVLHRQATGSGRRDIVNPLQQARPEAPEKMNTKELGLPQEWTY